MYARPSLKDEFMPTTVPHFLKTSAYVVLNCLLHFLLISALSSFEVKIRPTDDTDLFNEHGLKHSFEIAMLETVSMPKSRILGVRATISGDEEGFIL